MSENSVTRNIDGLAVEPIRFIYFPHVRCQSSILITNVQPRMAMLEEFHLSHLPPQLSVFVAQYKDVDNASFLQDQLLAGNAEFEYAFLDASMVRFIVYQSQKYFQLIHFYRFFPQHMFLQQLSELSMIPSTIALNLIMFTRKLSLP